MSTHFSSTWKKFVKRHSRHNKKRARSTRRRRGGKKKHSKKKHGKKKRSRKSRRGTVLKSPGLGEKIKPPSSLSIFPDKSPQLQKPGEPTKLTRFTTKNLAVQDNKGRAFNAIVNGRLAYRRAPRGQNVQDFSDTIYGSPVKELTVKNYKELRKGDFVYYDRGSVLFRGPFVYKGLRRGPELLLEINDSVYDKKYSFVLSVKRLKEERLFMVIKKKKTRKKGGRRQRGADRIRGFIDGARALGKCGSVFSNYNELTGKCEYWKDIL